MIYLPRRGGGWPVSSYLMAYEKQATVTGPNKATRRENELFSAIVNRPREQFSEFAFSGPYHLGEWLQKRHLPKHELQRELESILGANLDKSKPVAAFFVDEFCNPGQVEDALRRLAPKLNLIIKSWIQLDFSNIPGVIQWPQKGYAPNLLRFAADVIFCGFFSGTLCSSTMPGLNVIPYYTPWIHRHGRGANEPAIKFEAFADGLKGMISDYPSFNIIKNFIAPSDLTKTTAIMDKITDKGYWIDYRQALPALHEGVFGKFELDAAPEKTAKMLMDNLENRSFGADTAAVAARSPQNPW